METKLYQGILSDSTVEIIHNRLNTEHAVHDYASFLWVLVERTSLA